MSSTVASQIIAKLNLQPHPEGGFYAESSRDKSLILSKSDLPPQFKVDRTISTCIYLLLPSGSLSNLHRIPSTETWNFYLGDPVTVPIEIIVIPYLYDQAIRRMYKGMQILEMNEADGSVKLTCLGSNIIGENHLLQYTVQPNVWFGAFPTMDINISENNKAVKNIPKDAEKLFSLVGCTCAPAFEFADFELANQADLVERFPSYGSLISMLTLPG